MKARTAKRPQRALLTKAELMAPHPVTCAVCGTACVHVPREQPKTLPRGYDSWLDWMKEAAKVVCPHCTPLPVEKRPVWEYGRVVKPCGCGSAACPVPAHVERMLAR